MIVSAVSVNLIQPGFTNLNSTDNEKKSTYFVERSSNKLSKKSQFEVEEQKMFDFRVK
jgi:hypothetical protein